MNHLGIFTTLLGTFALTCVRTSAFVSLSPAFAGNGNLKGYLRAYSDGESGITGGINLDKSLQSNVVQNNLPPEMMGNGGKITMVGSGPGDPDLLTMAAHKILADPDVLVISDRLVSKEIIDLIQGECKVARKLPGCAEAAQEEVRFIDLHECYLKICSNILT